MSREHLGPLPQRLLLAEHGERAARRPHPAGPAKTRLSRRLQAPEESERGADVLLHRVVSVRLYEDSALGLAAAHLGHFPVRGRESAVQDGAGHFGGVLGPPKSRKKCSGLCETLDLLRNPPEVVLSAEYLIFNMNRMGLTERDFEVEHQRQTMKMKKGQQER